MLQPVVDGQAEKLGEQLFPRRCSGVLNLCLFGIQSSGYRAVDLPPVLAFRFLVRRFFGYTALVSPLVSTPAVQRLAAFSS